jgi:hypothetical protein
MALGALRGGRIVPNGRRDRLCVPRVDLGFSFLCVSVFAVLLALFQERRLGQYATAEIEAIAADKAASAKIKPIFDAL